MVNLIITDNDNSSNQLEVFTNTNNKILIRVGELADDNYSGWCTLDKDDAKALVKELNKLIKDLP
jgi:hypothetical protein